MIIQHQVHRRGNWDSIKLCAFQKPLGFHRLGTLFIRTKDQIFQGFQLSPSQALTWFPLLLTGHFYLDASFFLYPFSFLTSPRYPWVNYSEMTLPFDALIRSLTSPFHQFIFSPFCLITFHPPYLALWTSHWIYCKYNPLVLLPQFLTSEIHNTLHRMTHWKLCLDYIFESVHCCIYKR